MFLLWLCGSDFFFLSEKFLHNLLCCWVPSSFGGCVRIREKERSMGKEWMEHPAYHLFLKNVWTAYAGSYTEHRANLAYCLLSGQPDNFLPEPKTLQQSSSGKGCLEHIIFPLSHLISRSNKQNCSTSTWEQYIFKLVLSKFSKANSCQG